MGFCAADSHGWPSIMIRWSAASKVGLSLGGEVNSWPRPRLRPGRGERARELGLDCAGAVLGRVRAVGLRLSQWAALHCIRCFKFLFNFQKQFDDFR